MKIMEIDIDRMEARISIKDDVSKEIRQKTFFLYKGGIHFKDIFDFCLEAIDKYGVEQIDFLQGGVDSKIFYKHLTEKRHTAAEGIVINQYSVGRIVV